MLVWEDKCFRRETCTVATFPIRNPTWTNLSLSLVVLGERPALTAAAIALPFTYRVPVKEKERMRS
jgi:hypothetical protein